jgi:hypothetical protein
VLPPTEADRLSCLNFPAERACSGRPSTAAWPIRGLMHHSKQQYQSSFSPATLATTMVVERRGGVIYVGFWEADRFKTERIDFGTGRAMR